VLNYWISQMIRRYLHWLKFLQIILCCCFCILAVLLFGGIFDCNTSFICRFSVIAVLFCVLWTLHSWKKLMEQEIRLSRFHNTWCTCTLGHLFEHILKNYLFHWQSFFFMVKRRTSILETPLLKRRIIRISGLLDMRLMEFCCT
jgi:hypothetical protein